MNTVEDVLPAAAKLRAKVEAGEITPMQLLDELVREKARSELLRRRVAELEKSSYRPAVPLKY